MGAVVAVAQIEGPHDKRKARELQDKTKKALDVLQLRSLAYWSTEN
jgi:hypothetical protein